MPRANKMTPPSTIHEDKVFYWPDVGPVKVRITGGKIVSAAAVDPEIEDWEADGRIQDLHSPDSGERPRPAAR